MAAAGRYVRLWGLVGGALFFLAALYVTIDMNSRGISTSAPVSFGPHSAGHVGTDPDCHKYPLLQKGCLNQVIAARLTRASVAPVPSVVFREALLVAAF